MKKGHQQQEGVSVWANSNENINEKYMQKSSVTNWNAPMKVNGKSNTSADVCPKSNLFVEVWVK
jgi:hypothetical protein